SAASAATKSCMAFSHSGSACCAAFSFSSVRCISGLGTRVFWIGWVFWLNFFLGIGFSLTDRMAVIGGIAAGDIVFQLTLDIGEQGRRTNAEQVRLQPFIVQFFFHQ